MAGTGLFQAYDPTTPPNPAAVETVSTDTGVTVPYVVRYERGSVDRGIYDEAILGEPGKTYTPWQPPPAWDHKATYYFDGGCGLSYTQGSDTSGYGDPDTTVGYQTQGHPGLDEWSLMHGRAVLFATTSTSGTNCQTITGAETIMQTKALLANEFGPIRFMSSFGCSGGAILPTQVADAYPGLFDGLLPHCSYPDLWSPLLFGVMDCMVLVNYFDSGSTGFSA